MLDINFIRQNADKVAQAAADKGYRVDIGQLLALDQNRRELTGQIESLRRQRNQLAEQSGKNAKPGQDKIIQGKQLKSRMAELEDRLSAVNQQYWQLLKDVPNMPADDVPVGASEDDNQVTKTVGETTRFDFTPKTHWEIGEQRGWIDKQRAAKVAGSRFAYLKGDLVLLQWAMMRFGLGVLTDEAVLRQIISQNGLSVPSKPFVPVLPPAMARTEVYEATGRLSGGEMTYKLEDDDLWLNASAEHTLCPMYMDEIVAEADLPLRFVGYTTAFRREAGTYGKDVEGILRLHQFDKLEMESFTVGEASYQEHLFMIAVQEYLMSRLGLPYRVVLKCTADIGKPNARGVDIDVWLPGQNRYRETHTADLITDYQARRLNTRVRRANGRLELVHTNDATAFSQRPLIAILENYQTADGRVGVPEALRPFMDGREYI